MWIFSKDTLNANTIRGKNMKTKIKQNPSNIRFIRMFLVTAIFIIFLSGSVLADVCSDHFQSQKNNQWFRGNDIDFAGIYSTTGDCYKDEHFFSDGSVHPVDCDAATEYYIKSAEFYLKSESEHFLKSSAYNNAAAQYENIVRCYRAERKCDTAAKYIAKAEELYLTAIESGEESWKEVLISRLTGVLSVAANCYRDQNCERPMRYDHAGSSSCLPYKEDCDIATQYDLKAVEYTLNLKNDFYYAGTIYSGIAYCYRYSKNRDCDTAAEYNIKSAELYAKSVGLDLGEGGYRLAGNEYSYLGECYEIKGDCDNAIKYWSLAIEYYNKAGSDTSFIESLIESCDDNQPGQTTKQIKKIVSKTEKETDEEDGELIREQNKEGLQFDLEYALDYVENDNASRQLQQNIERFQQAYPEKMQRLIGFEIEDFNEETGAVLLSAEDEVKFFGFIKWKIIKIFEIDENGNITERVPWYRFLYREITIEKKIIKYPITGNWCPEGGEWNLGLDSEDMPGDSQGKWEIDKLMTSGKYSGLCHVLFTDGDIVIDYYFSEDGQSGYFVMDVNGQKIEQEFNY